MAGYAFDFDGFRVGIRVPHGRAYNPENNEGWEGVGVIPHIAVPADRALETAYADAVRKLMEAEEDEQLKAGLEWIMTDISSRLEPIELSNKQTKEYAGFYGPRHVFIENGVLYYQREGGPRHVMEPMGEDLFRVGDLDYFRLTFERNRRGKIVKIIGLYDDGHTDEHERSD